MSDLLPCPFCGSGHVLGDGEADDNWFECMTCHARGPRTTTADTIGASQDAWNRRAANAAPDPALLALDRELRIRNLIAEREFNTAAANREIAQFGEWRWDHDAADKACAAAIAALLAPDGADGAGEVGHG